MEREEDREIEREKTENDRTVVWEISEGKRQRNKERIISLEKEKDEEKKENGETKIYKKLQGETRKKETRKNKWEVVRK